MKNRLDTLTKEIMCLGIITVCAALCGTACSNDGSSGSSCGAPNGDGDIHEFLGSCRVGDEEEHIRLGALSITGAGQKVSVWAKAASADGSDGIRIAIDETNIVYTNIDASDAFTEAHSGITDKLLCFDLHYEESPVHALAWKGNECNNAKKGNAGTTIFNKNAGTGNDVDSQNLYLYKIEGGASASLIRTQEPLFEE